MDTSAVLSPQEADYRWFTVTAKGALQGGGYAVRVHKYMAYLFSRGNSSADGTRPGWLGAITFDTYDEAVTFGTQLATHIERARQAHGEHNAAVGAATDLIYKEYGQRAPG